jgi:polar amino acid transport system substrate-binding protein
MSLPEHRKEDTGPEHPVGISGPAADLPNRDAPRSIFGHPVADHAQGRLFRLAHRRKSGLFNGPMTGRKWLLSVGLMILLSGAVRAQVPAMHTPLIVGTKEAPPFAMKGPDGKWTGISIDLWQDLAAQLKLRYEFREMDLDHLLSGVTNGTLDASVAAVTVTSDRERVMDFTHPFYITGLGIAVSAPAYRPWMAVLRRVLSRQFLAVITLLALLLTGVGLLMWLFERRQNSEQFGGKAHEGIGSGFWWSAVTMTTVGYGDKAPRTLVGRLLGVVWMFAGIIIVSSFTAAITSALTISQMGSSLHGPAGLPDVRVAAVASSTAEQYLQGRHISFQSYPDALGALQALAAGKADAVVYDAPILQYLARQNFPGAISVLPHTFVRQDYAIAVAQGSPLRETLDRVLEREIRSPRWQEVIDRYLGREE